MAELDLSAYLADTGVSEGGLVLTGIKSPKHPNGKSYTCARISALDQLRLERTLIAETNGVKLSPAEQADADKLLIDRHGKKVNLGEKLLGDAYQEMLDDGIDSEAIDRVETAVMMYHAGGAERAQEFVQAVGKALAAKRRPAKKTTSTPRKRAGSKSSPASSRTAARSRTKSETTRTSGQSSTSPTARAKKQERKTA